MKRQLLAACLSLPLLGTVAFAQTTAPNIIEIWPLVKDIRPLVTDISSVTALTLSLQRTTSAVKAEPEVISAEAEAIVAEPEAINSDPKVIKGGKSPLNNKGQAISANVTALNKAMAEIGAKESKKDIRVNLSSDVLFDFDSARVKPRAAAALAQTSLIIRQRRRGWVWIYGHTDSKGSDAYNIRLSEQRANSVKTWLIINGGFPGTFFATRGFGEQYPIAQNTNSIGGDDPQGRARNRRVEIIIETVRRQ